MKCYEGYEALATLFVLTSAHDPCSSSSTIHWSSHCQYTISELIIPKFTAGEGAKVELKSQHKFLPWHWFDWTPNSQLTKYWTIKVTIIIRVCHLWDNAFMAIRHELSVCRQQLHGNLPNWDLNQKQGTELPETEDRVQIIIVHQEVQLLMVADY